MSKLGFLDVKGEYPRVTQTLQLSAYHKDLKGNYLEIWLNWDRDFNDRMAEYNGRIGEISRMPTGTEEEREAQDAALDEIAPEMFGLNAEFWGCSEDEAQAIYEVDAELWRWIAERANLMREAYRKRRKKVG